MKTVLLTGFEPFGGHASNPSQIIAEHLRDRVLHKHRVVGATLACEFGKSLRQLKTLMKEHQPALVICLGLAGGRDAITPERVAINVDDARIPDNAGVQHAGKPVVRGGPVAYWSTLPVKAIASALMERGIPAAVSQTAGTFVCNHVFYGLMHELAKQPGSTRGGFIHVPYLAGSGESPALSLETMVDGIALAIGTALRRKKDQGDAAGSLH